MAEMKETMADFASELEASYKEFDNRQFEMTDAEGVDAEKWQELVTMMQEKTVIKVKVKEAVKSGLVAYVDEIRGFIPVSQISTQYVEKLEEWVGKYLEVRPITVDPAVKKLVLSARVLQKEKEDEEKAAKLAECKVGAVVEGTVDSLKDYGAFINLDNGLSGLLHISQISTQRIKNPAAVLKEGEKITVKIIGINDGKISLSKKALEVETVVEVFDYQETGAAFTGLSDLLKGFKLD